MRRLVLASTDSAGGCLKAAGIAEKVIALGIEFLLLPAPAITKPLKFFDARRALLGSQHYGYDGFVDGAVRTKRHLRRLISTARSFDRIELWCDPDPNAQLQTMFMLHWLGSLPRVARKLVVFHADRRLGEERPEDVQAWQPLFVTLNSRQFAMASKVWCAYQQPTPEAWFALLRDDNIDSFPFLRTCVIKLLRELPGHSSGLSSTELRLLQSVARGRTTARAVFAGLYPPYERSPLEYWALGHLLCGLAMCDEPALTGVTERKFNLDFHDDEARFTAFMASEITTTSFGRMLLDGTEDFARHNRIDYWWGGTRLTNARLWRWDEQSQALVAPNSV